MGSIYVSLVFCALLLKLLFQHAHYQMRIQYRVTRDVSEEKLTLPGDLTRRQPSVGKRNNDLH